jgi:hypothetical protein
MSTVIKVENLSKRYRLGVVDRDMHSPTVSA